MGGGAQLIGLATAAQSEDRLREALITFRDRLGLAHAAYHAHEPGAAQDAPVIVLTYPQSWINRYRERNYFAIDPVLTLGPLADFPLDWADIDRTSDAVSEFFGDAYNHGVGRSGLTLPLRTVAGERAAFSITSNRERSAWEAMRWGRSGL